MARALPLLWLLLLGTAFASTPLPPVPAGSIPMVVTRERAKLQLARGGTTELKPGTHLELIEIDEKTATARVRFRSAEGSIPLRAIAEERPAPQSAAAAVAAPSPPPGFSTGTKPQPLTPEQVAKLPAEVQQAIRQAQADAARAGPGGVPAGREAAHQSSTEWVQVKHGADPSPIEVPPGATVTRSETSTRTTEVTVVPSDHRLRFASEEAARAYAADPAAQAKAAEFLAAQRAKAEAELRAKAKAAEAAPRK